MNNKEKYKDELNKINTPEYLINKTTSKILNLQNKPEKKFVFYKYIVGFACVLLLTVIVGKNIINDNNKTYKNENNIEKQEYSSKFLQRIDEDISEEDTKKIKLTVKNEELNVNKSEIYENTIKYIEEYTGNSNNLGVTSKLDFNKNNVNNHYKLLNKDLILVTINDKYIIRIPEDNSTPIIIIDLTKDKYVDYMIYPEENNSTNELRDYIIKEFNTEKSNIENSEKDNIENEINKENENNVIEKENQNNENEINNENENNVIENENQNNENEINNENLKPYGDVNRDGLINMHDVWMIEEHNSRKKLIEDSIMKKAADVDNDGYITGADAVLLKASIGNKIKFDGTKPIENILYGDIDKDGIITSKDYKDLKRHISGEIKLTYSNLGDINNDSKVDETDLILIEGILNNTFNHYYLLEPLTNYTIYGDVDLNGKIQSRDVTVLKNYLSNKITLNEQQLKNADVNGDKKINETDSLLILEFIVKKHENTLPFKIITKEPEKEEIKVELKPYGDINKDGKISSYDVTLIKQHIEEINKINDEETRKSADVNGDGLITGTDATLLQYAIVQKIDFDGTNTISNILYGDVTNDGKITQEDYNNIERHINGEITLTNIKQADINNDNQVNNTDLLLIEGILNSTFKHDMLYPLTNYTLYGDVDLNGKIQSRDTTVLKNYLLNNKTLNEQQLKNADVNADGKIDETDAKLIQEFIVQMHENTLPFKPIK